MLLCLLIRALADEPVTPEDRALHLIEEAMRMRQAGDATSAMHILTDIASMVPPTLKSAWLYQQGVTAELSGDTESAERFYLEVIAYNDTLVPDARLRLAMVYQERAYFEGAYEQILALSGYSDLSEADQALIALQKGITELNMGHKRKGIQDIQTALVGADAAKLSPWLRAEAHYALAKVLYDEAMDIHLPVSERRAVRALKAHSERMKAAEQQVLAIIQLNEVEWVLAALLVMGDAWRDYALELAAVPPPRRVAKESDTLVAWKTAIGHYTDNANGKAWNAYDQGIKLAIRLAWESPRVAELKARQAELPSPAPPPAPRTGLEQY